MAVVTGAGGGIGAGMAEAFAAEGMHVVVADIEEASAQATAERVRAAGVRSVAVHTDVADPASVAALADRAFAEFGEVHLLCNNAGVLLFRPLAEMSLQDWQWLLSVNLFGVIHGIHSFLPRMLAQGGDGHIVNTASIAGLAVGRVRNVGAYHASKYAVVGLSEALRTELEPAGIGVSMICPGGVNTRIAEAERNRPAAMGPASSLGRAGPANAVGRMEPSDIARLVVRGVRENRKFIITHPERRREVADRCEHLLQAFDEAAAEEQAAEARR